MSRLTFFLTALLVATAAYAQAPSPSEPDPVTVMVPVVGRLWGVSGIHWRTDVELVNDTAEAESVILSLPTTPDQPFISFDIPPHGAQRFTDVVGQAFGIDRALSPLMVQTAGKRSVRVSASVYAVQGEHVTRPEPIPVAYSDAFFPIRVLYGLTFNDAFRTNIGFANLNDREALFTIALQLVSGRNISVTQLTVPPNTLWHTSIQALFPMITKGDDFSILIETGSRDTYVYGSVIDNATNDAHFVQPMIAPPTINSSN